MPCNTVTLGVEKFGLFNKNKNYLTEYNVHLPERKSTGLFPSQGIFGGCDGTSEQALGTGFVAVFCKFAKRIGGARRKR